MHTLISCAAQNIFEWRVQHTLNRHNTRQPVSRQPNGQTERNENYFAGKWIWANASQQTLKLNAKKSNVIQTLADFFFIGFLVAVQWPRYSRFDIHNLTYRINNSIISVHQSCENESMRLRWIHHFALCGRISIVFLILPYSRWICDPLISFIIHPHSAHTESFTSFLGDVAPISIIWFPCVAFTTGGRNKMWTEQEFRHQLVSLSIISYRITVCDSSALALTPSCDVCV